MEHAVFDFADTDHDDLVSGRSPWNGKSGRPHSHPFTESFKTDVAIVGGGITGAFAAQHLSAMGLSVCVIDKEQPGLGSTSASTAMLLWETDSTLKELTGYYGFERASAIYRRSHSAVGGLTRLITGLGLDCAFRQRNTVYIAGEDQEPDTLREEALLRARVDLPSRFLSQNELHEAYALSRSGAIVSTGSAEADPLQLAWELLRVSVNQGVRLVDASAIAFDEEGGRITIQTDTPYLIEARHVALATGYVMPGFIMPKQHHIASSWAVATQPQAPETLWRDRALIWEASEPYLYLRTTADNRIVIGGEDEEMDDPERREAKLAEKADILRQKLEKLWPAARPVLSHAWCGAFGETDDGLPLIGKVPGTNGLFAAYGYGGNGITFSYMAAQMAGAFIQGQSREWFDDFALDRPSPLD